MVRLHRHHRRVLPQGPPRRRPRAQLPEGQASRRCPSTCRSAHRKHMKWTPGRLLNWGQNIGAGTRAVVQWQLEQPAPPRAGLPGVPGAAEPVQDLRRGASGGGMPPGAGHRRPAPQTHHRDPQSQARPASGPLPRSRHGGCRRPRARTAMCAAPITSVTRRPTTETTTTDEGDDDSCLSNPRSIH